MTIKESDLYPPIKTYLESQGYEVKSEIGHLDLLARRGQEPPVVVEMKTSFSLTLILQGVERQTLFDHVYIAVPVPAKGWTLRYKDLIRLCRRLGLGLLAVKSGEVQAHLDPAPYTPRKNTVKSARLLREFDRRQGDPNTGGTNRVKQMTAYRQDAMRCAGHLASHGPSKPALIVRTTGVTRAPTILRDNHYGWFERVSRGIYALTPTGKTASSAGE
ncbi:MAG: hypothetical protein H7245_12100, partial [Candidatus Saccharibacteria bacterium]|nr:hypothetical protein [Pseudorhodobacter sp.]